MKPGRKGRAAFTLIELLVVVAIILILLGILVPAVNKVLQLSYRTQCAGQMRQLGMGLVSYEKDQDRFPFAIINKSGVTRHAWIPYALPYTDAKNVYDKYDLKVNWNDSKNQAITKSRVPLLECPSTVRASIPAGSLAPTDYTTVCQATTNAFSNGWITAPYPGLNTSQKQVATRGIMIWDDQNNFKPVRASDVRDGVSNTLLIIEVAGRPARWMRGGIPSLDASSPLGGYWADPATEVHFNTCKMDGTDVGNGGPCPMNCTNNNEIYSFHWSGANFAFADGSVRFLRDGLSNNIIIALISRAGGETAVSAAALE